MKYRVTTYTNPTDILVDSTTDNLTIALTLADSPYVYAARITDNRTGEILLEKLMGFACFDPYGMA